MAKQERSFFSRLSGHSPERALLVALLHMVGSLLIFLLYRLEGRPWYAYPVPVAIALLSLVFFRRYWSRRKYGPPILEAALLDVRPGQSEDFERAFDQAKRIIAASPGFVSLELQRCFEVPDRYLLLVRWRTREDHTEGFRSSASYQDWKAALHHFYDPFPTVEHFALVEEAKPSRRRSETRQRQAGSR